MPPGVLQLPQLVPKLFIKAAAPSSTSTVCEFGGTSKQNSKHIRKLHARWLLWLWHASSADHPCHELSCVLGKHLMLLSKKGGIIGKVLWQFINIESGRLMRHRPISSLKHRQVALQEAYLEQHQDS
jgi:hypothetical protein